MGDRFLLTGASGFVGSIALDHLLTNTDSEIVCPVTYRHQGDGARIHEVIDRHAASNRVDIVAHDLALPITPMMARRFGPVDYVWNIASESHVDRSIADPVPFVRNNVELVMNVLEYVRNIQPRTFLHMSTDEVFGPAAEGYQHHEWDAIRPSNPYAASKAAQEAIVHAWWRTFGLPLVLTNTMNLIAPAAQAPEKYIPKVARAIFQGEKLTVHASPDGASGSRCWVDARDFAASWLWLTARYDGSAETVYSASNVTEPTRFNIVGDEASNLEVALRMADISGRPLDYELVDYHSQRPGHDHRYALDGSKLASMGAPAMRPLGETLSDIVEWYAANPAWMTTEVTHGKA